MTNPLSAESQSRVDSALDDKLETESPPEKRARTSTNSPTTSTKDTSVVVFSTTTTSRRDREQVAVSTTTNELGNSIGSSSRMYVFRRAGRTRGVRRFDAQQTDLSDPLRDGWAYGSEEENGSSGAEDDEKQTRTGWRHYLLSSLKVLHLDEQAIMQKFIISVRCRC